ncbi:MAG: FAD-binding oxidoreductase [Cyanobacteriota bacterium]|nr:FAD-binding oxidoreductase [Cyanobacteriota bacterium]
MTVAPNRQPLTLDQLLPLFGGMETITDPPQIAKLSQDYYTFSPVLQRQLHGKLADLVVRPADETEVKQAAAICAQSGIPLTVRGAGTGNYGQCVPLRGGVVLDMSRLNRVLWVKPGVVRVEAGAKLAAIDKQTRESGWEIRMAPSTYRTASIGGFIAGGSGGIGSVTYGQLRDRGNILALRVVTVEPEPRVIELRGEAVHKVSHAWGLNGIITEVEMPLAPAYPWAELVVCFPEFMPAAHFGQALAEADGITKKMISIHAWPIPSYFAALKSYLPEGSHSALLMIAEPSLEAVSELVKEHGGTIVYQKSALEASRGLALGEYTWNHTTLHARSVDPSLTYLQTLFPPDRHLKLVEQMFDHFGDEVLMHLEFVRVQGCVQVAALQIVRFRSEARLHEIIRYHEEQGAFIANPHTYIIEDGGRKEMDPQQLIFKKQVDPYGLLNPGKMKTPLLVE